VHASAPRTVRPQIGFGRVDPCELGFDARNLRGFLFGEGDFAETEDFVASCAEVDHQRGSTSASAKPRNVRVRTSTRAELEASYTSNPARSASAMLLNTVIPAIRGSYLSAAFVPRSRPYYRRSA
jgi:hypothetical protein